MKVSVCMVTYNHEAFIAEAIDSVLMQQSNFDFELVIGEDCSTDKTRDICLAYQERNPDTIRLLLPDSNQGMMRNFVQTLGACTGEYVALLDGDDYWLSPDKLQKQVDFLEVNPEYSICFTDTIYYPSGDRTNPSYRPDPKPSTTTLSIDDLLRWNPIGTPSVMFRNKLISAFPDWFHSLRVADWPLHILNAQYGKVAYLPGVTAFYRTHPDSVHASLNVAEQRLRTLAVIEAMQTHLDPRYSQLAKRALAGQYTVLMLEHLFTHDLIQAIGYAAKAIKSGAIRLVFSKSALRTLRRRIGALVSSARLQML